MKRLKLIVLSVFMCIILSSCQIAILSFNTRGNGYLKHKYVYLSGEKTYSMKVNAACDISFDVESNGGSLSLELTNASGEVLYTNEAVLTSEFTVHTSSAGKHILKVISNKAKGSYSLEWPKE